MQKAEPSRGKWWTAVFLLIALLVVVADQLSKIWIRSNLAIGESVPETGLFRITHINNTGASFGLFSDQSFSLMIVAGVGIAIVLGVIRILKGWPLHFMIAGGYVLVVLMTVIAPREIIGLAYDSGGVTTSTITVPLVTALGVGLASSIKGRNPMLDGFGLIAFASLTPMVFVMAYGMLI